MEAMPLLVSTVVGNHTASAIRKALAETAVGKAMSTSGIHAVDRDRAEHADERLYPVGEGFIEADGDTGQHADDCTAEPAEEQQACRVCKAGREERAVLNEYAEHAVERGKVQHR